MPLVSASSQSGGITATFLHKRKRYEISIEKLFSIISRRFSCFVSVSHHYRSHHLPVHHNNLLACCIVMCITMQHQSDAFSFRIMFLHQIVRKAHVNVAITVVIVNIVSFLLIHTLFSSSYLKTNIRSHNCVTI
jgi:hypothetical protein